MRMRTWQRLDKVQLREEGDDVVAVGGLAAVFFRKDDPGTQYNIGQRYAERLSDGAFDHLLSDDADIISTFNHDESQLLGRTLAGTVRVWVDADGLRYETILPRSPVGQNVAEWVRRGDVRGSSIKFKIEDEDRTQEDGRIVYTIRKAQALVELGPVARPAFKATTAEMRSDRFARADEPLPDAPSDEELAHILRCRELDLLMSDHRP